jgi:hypothetical protein
VTVAVRKVDTDEPADRVAAMVRGVMAKELERVQAERDRLAAIADRAEASADRAETEIMAACKAVAKAVDRLEQQRYTPSETHARRQLERVADELRQAMRKHKRFPAGRA